MAAEKFDFAEFLALLEAKRAALDTLIASYKAAVSVGALGQIGEGGLVLGGSADIQLIGGGRAAVDLLPHRQRRPS